MVSHVENICVANSLKINLLVAKIILKCGNFLFTLLQGHNRTLMQIIAAEAFKDQCPCSV